MYNPDLEELRNIFDFLFPEYTPRKGQLETCQVIIRGFENNEHVVLEAPTGSGKSILANIVGEYFARYEKRSLITTVTKSLQDQYLKDFILADIRSASNEEYRCKEGLVRTEVECSAVSKSKGCDRFCPYKTALIRFFKARMALTNLQFVCRIPQTGRTFLTIIDECHELASVVSSAVEFKIPDLNEVLIRFLIPDEVYYDDFMKKYAATVEVLSKFKKDQVFKVPNISEAVQAHTILKLHVEEAKIKAEQLITNKMFKKAYSHCSVRLRALDTLISNFDNLFISFGDNEFKPVYASEFTNDLIFSKSNKTLHMSATICGFEAYCDEVGIDPKCSTFVEMSHVIPAERREVEVVPVAWMSYKNYDEDIVKTVEEIDSLYEQYEGNNTILHTASYKRAEDIAKRSRHKIHVPRNHKEVIALLKSQSKGVIVASPSIVAGIDAKDDMCRLNIITKLPYPSLADPRMKYIMGANPQLYNLKVVRDIVQACGRGTRHEEDYSFTFIIDGNFIRLYKQYKRLFPTWFSDALKGV